MFRLKKCLIIECPKRQWTAQKKKNRWEGTTHYATRKFPTVVCHAYQMLSYSEAKRWGNTMAWLLHGVGPPRAVRVRSYSCCIKAPVSCVIRIPYRARISQYEQHTMVTISGCRLWTMTRSSSLDPCVALKLHFLRRKWGAYAGHPCWNIFSLIFPSPPYIGRGRRNSGPFSTHIWHAGWNAHHLSTNIDTACSKKPMAPSLLRVR